MYTTAEKVMLVITTAVGIVCIIAAVILFRRSVLKLQAKVGIQ